MTTRLAYPGAPVDAVFGPPAPSGSAIIDARADALHGRSTARAAHKRPEPAMSSRPVIIAFGIVNAVTFVAAITMLFIFLLQGA